MAGGETGHNQPIAGQVTPSPEARVGAAMKAARENYRYPDSTKLPSTAWINEPTIGSDAQKN
jgi:hypothetical protein